MTPSLANRPTAALRARLHVAIYVANLAPLASVVEKLSRWALSYTVSVATSVEEYVREVDSAFRTQGIEAHVSSANGVGRDILPFLLAANALADGPEDVLLLKLVLAATQGDDVSQSTTLDGFLDPEHIERLVADFDRLPDLALVLPHDSADLSVVSAEPKLQQLFRRLKFKDDADTDSWRIGPMFMVRPYALRPLLDLNLGESDFESSADFVGSGMADAIDGALFSVIRANGYYVAGAAMIEDPVRPPSGSSTGEMAKQSVGRSPLDTEKHDAPDTSEGTRNELSTARASTSWKLTAPLRKAKRLGNIVGDVAHRLGRHRRLHGGWINTGFHFARTIRREGFAGLSKRVARLSDGNGFDYKLPTEELYRRWVDRYDALDEIKSREIRQDIEGWGQGPLFSIIVSLRDGQDRLVRQTIDGLRAQLYARWQLILFVPSSASTEFGSSVAVYCALDPRITSVQLPDGGDATSLDALLGRATGEYVIFPECGDVFASHGFYLAAQYIRRIPEAEMLYGDVDVLDSTGGRSRAMFKPDWNPLLLLGVDFVSDCAIYSTDLLRKVDLPQVVRDSGWRYDLVLRCAEQVDARSIVHVPHVMVHLDEASAVAGSLAKLTAVPTVASPPDAVSVSHASATAILAVQRHLERRGIRADVVAANPSMPLRRITYSIPTPPPRVSVVVPTRDGLSLLRRCIDSVIEKTTYPNYEIVIVDNGSVAPETLAYFDSLRAHPGVSIVRDDSPFNFSALNNRAIENLQSEFVCLLNNDVEVISPEWLDEMVGLATQPGAGAIGASLWYPDDTLQHGGVLLGYGGVAGHLHHMLSWGRPGYYGRALVAQNLSAVTAACLLIRRAIYEEVGGMDEDLAVAFNDVDFCIRVDRAGYRNAWTPHARLYHFESASRGTDMSPDKFQRFQSEVRRMQDRWGESLNSDPAYNPNLNLSAEQPQFSLSEPPRLAQLD
jgi:GT2 family glycosyltransferase